MTTSICRRRRGSGATPPMTEWEGQDLLYPAVPHYLEVSIRQNKAERPVRFDLTELTREIWWHSDAVVAQQSAPMRTEVFYVLERGTYYQKQVS
jgi:hypothetical protein